MIKPEEQFSRTHAYLGVFICFLSIVQIVLGIFRPHKDPDAKTVTRGRRIFEIAHIWNGRSIVLLSIIQIFLGIEAKSNPKYPFYFNYIYAVFPFCFFVFIVVHEIMECFVTKRLTIDSERYLLKDGEHDY
jgi:hypothetical protein